MESKIFEEEKSFESIYEQSQCDVTDEDITPLPIVDVYTKMGTI